MIMIMQLGIYHHLQNSILILSCSPKSALHESSILSDHVDSTISCLHVLHVLFACGLTGANTGNISMFNVINLVHIILY